MLKEKIRDKIVKDFPQPQPKKAEPEDQTFLSLLALSHIFSLQILTSAYGRPCFIVPQYSLALSRPENTRQDSLLVSHY